MDEQILKDLVATAQANNYKWDVIVGKFPELKGYDAQLLKDYVATAEKHNYDYGVVNSKFPEFSVKKKVETDVSASVQNDTDITSEGGPQKSVQSGGTSGSSVPGIKSWSDIATKKATDQLKQAPRAAVKETVKNKASDFIPKEQKFEYEAAPKKEEVGPVSKAEIQRQKNFDELVIAEPGSKEQAAIIEKKTAEREREDFERNEYLSAISDDIITGNEEDAVKTLREKYGKFGFTFEEKGLGDAMRVTSKYGDPLEIDLDISEMLTGAVTQQSDALKDYLWKNKSTSKDSGLVDVLKTMKTQPGAVSEKMYSKLSEGIDNQINELSQSQTKLAADIKSFEAAAKETGALTPEQHKEYTAMLKEYNNGIPEARRLENLRKEINTSAGIGLKQVIARNEKLGTTSGALGNSLLKGVESIVSGATTFGFTLVDAVDEAASLVKYTSAYQQMFGKSDVVEMSKTYQDLSKRSDFRKEEIKKNREKIKGALVAELGSTTSKEYTESDDRGLLMKAAMGVTESAPAMLTGFTGMALQSFDAVAEEWVDNPEYEDMPLSDLLVVGGSVAIIQGALEKYGLTSILSDNPAGKTFINKVLKNTFGKVAGKTSGESFNKLIAAETNSLIKNGVVKIVGGGLVEGETGALQEIADIGIKSIYNKLEGKEIFDTPETFGEAASQVAEAAKMEAIGGMLMKGAMSAPKMITDGIKKQEMEAPLVEALHFMSESPELRRSMVKTLKTEVLQKKMTLEEAKSKLADFEKMTTIMREIPMDISDKSAAFDLIIEKNRIEKEIEGKNVALTVTKKERIAEINTELIELATGVKTEEIVKTKDAQEDMSTPKVKADIDQVSLHSENGGSSISQTGEDLIGKPGFAVSTHTDKTKTVKGKEITQEDLDQYKEANKEALKDPNNFVGTWYDSKSDQTYIDISTRVENEQEAIDLAKANNQKAIFDLESMNEIDTGGTGEVKQETKKIKQETTATAQATTESLKEQFKEVKTEREQKVIRAANSVVKSLSSIPGVKVFVHNTTDAYNSAIAKATGESKESIDAETQKSLGEYISGAREIHINLENESTDATTVYHEAFHAVFEAKGIESGVAKEMVDGLKKIVKDKKLLARIDNFVSSYESGEQSEEFMAETVGILSEAAKTLDANGLHKLINLINKIATKILGKPLFKSTASRQEVLDFINKTSTSLRTGAEVDVTTEGVISGISPVRKAKLEPVSISEEQGLSFVTKDDLVDIESLIKDISDKGQRVWFWVADQLGRGMYFDAVTGKDHFLDAGPSYALDPENKKNNIIWASGMPKKSIENRINDSDYIFIFSGSPEKSKLFNQKVSGLIKDRIESNVKFDVFKRSILKADPIKAISEILNKYNSFDEIFTGKDRKKFILAINEQGKKNTKTSKLLAEYDAIVDPNDLRDGFYADNNFEQGDIMLILKPTKVGGKSKHSTYETDVLGEVVGVPDKKVNAFDIMPADFQDKYNADMNRAMQSQSVAPYGSGIKKVSPVRKKRVIPTDQAVKLTEDKDGNYYFENFGFSKKTTLKPSLATGVGLQTSKEERAAINSVGGLTMLYTMDNQTEMGVGDNKHKVLIPKEEVYHIQSDPNSYYEEARRQFNEVRPGQAFNSNYQAAWITKVANDNGYTVALANWRGDELRAQTTLDLTPTESDIEFKQKTTEEYKVGDEVNIFGVDVTITAIDGDMVTYKGDKDSGVVNIARNKKSIRKKRIFNKPANKINIAVTLLKEESKTDKEIREELKGEWYTDREIDNAIEEYNLKKEGIWTGQGRGKVERSALSFKKRYFSARKFLPKSAFKSKENKEAEIAVNLNSVDKNVKDFNRAYREYTGDKEKLTVDFDAYIRGDKTITLPDEIIKIAVSMRNHIDALSYSLIESGIVDTEATETITNNIGKYLTRSYRVYDRKNWKNEVEEEVLQKAKNMLRGQYLSAAREIAIKEGRDLDLVLDELVDGKIDNMLSKDGASKFISGSKLGSKDVSVLKEKTDIPVEIRALMGEYSDPALNYAKTVLKLSSLAANHKFLNDVKKSGGGVFLFDEPRGMYSVKIAGDTSKTMNPLNGMYTTKEIAEEFEAQPQDVGALLEYYMKVISTVKWAKTIGSIATHSKNITGNLGFVWLNGHSDISEMKGSYKTVKNDFSSKNKGDLREKMNHYISLGIVKQSAGLGEIMDMFKDANWDNAMATRLTNKELNLWQKSKRFALKSKKVLEDAYQAEDDFFKIVAYENELSRYSKAMFGKTKSELSKEERAEVDEVVAEIVKNTYPTYSRVPDAIQKIRRFPLIGNFISFQAESYRTAVNTALMTSSELRSENPAIRRIGARRLTGAITYLSAKTAILSYFSIAAGTGLAGIAGGIFNDDEEDQKNEDIRKFIAPWSEKSDLLILEASNGKIKYIDFSASDPHGAMHKLVNSMLSGENSLDAIKKGAIELIEPFVGVEITTAAANSLVNNKDSYGRPIWNVTDNKTDQSADIIAFVWKLVQPGTVTSINRVIDSEDRGTEIGAALSGFRVIETNVEDQFGFKVKSIGENLPNAKGDYNKAYREYEAGKITESELNVAYKKSNKKVKEIYNEMIDAYNSAERLGVDKDKLAEKLNQFGVSKYIIKEIQKNKIEDMRDKDYKAPSKRKGITRLH
jgi:hypothetical protein